MAPVLAEVMVKVPAPYLVMVPNWVPEATVSAGEPRTKLPSPTKDRVERFVRLL